MQKKRSVYAVMDNSFSVVLELFQDDVHYIHSHYTPAISMSTPVCFFFFCSQRKIISMVDKNSTKKDYRRTHNVIFAPFLTSQQWRLKNFCIQKVHVDGCEEDSNPQSHKLPLTKINICHNHQTIHSHSTKTRYVIFYHFVYCCFNDFIYGCALCTTLGQHRLIAFVLWLVIFTEGFQRHLRKNDFSFWDRITLKIP